MNKKLLFAAVSLAALTACSTDDFESQNIAAEKTSPVQFEVINNNDSFTRAYMDGSNIHWEASKGDLFTLYHGGSLDGTALKGYQNATYTAVEGDGAATLTTPSMILAGKAIMIWPVDTAFTNNGKDAVAISIPETLDNIENNITYASDLVEITEDAFTTNKQTAAYNKSGYNRKYPVYMRPLTSQLTLKADYAGTEKAIEALYEGTDPIDPIKVTSVDLTNTADKFTQKIALDFTEAKDADKTRWGGVKRVNTWSHITGFATTPTQVKKLTTKVLTGNESAKFLILPKSEADGNTAVVVNTTYGKVTTASYTTDDEKKKAWYKTTGKEMSVEDGMKEVFTAIDKATVSANTVVKDEPVGASATRYVKVLLKYIDMDGLHVTSDKQLYDAVRVWKELGLDNKTTNKITVYLDGDKGEFEISQKTIAKINELNAAAAKEETPRSFQVMPCTEHACNTIVITGGGEIPADLTFIKKNGTITVPVALNAGENWKWNSKNVTVDKDDNTGISSFINRGTFANDATATLKIMNNATPSVSVNNIGFVNNGTWNITAGELNVQFDVTNNGTVNISKGAQYRQDGTSNVFTNEAETLPKRFFTDEQKKKNEKEQIGVVNNSGVFAIVNGGKINNYGLIEHADVDAKTYITANQSLKADGFTADASFAKAFNKATSGDGNKLGRINLPYSNRTENQLSISNATANGLVSVTVSTEEPGSAPEKGKLDLTKLGDYVNFCIINSGVTEVTKASDKVEYLEFNAGSTEIEINTDFVKTAGGKTINENLTGLIVLSPITIIRNKTVEATATYLGANLYKAGAFTCTNFNAYFGDTDSNKNTKIITWGN